MTKAPPKYFEQIHYSPLRQTTVWILHQFPPRSVKVLSNYLGNPLYVKTDIIISLHRSTTTLFLIVHDFH